MPTLTPRQIATSLGVSRDTALRYLRDGLVPGFQLRKNGPWRTDVATFEKWLEDRTNSRRALNDAPLPEDPNRIEPRSARSQAAMARHTA